LSARDGHSHEAHPPELRVDALRNQQRILLAAARLLADDSSVSIQRIADEAQVARPTVYRRYPTREALVEAIQGEAIAEFSKAMEQANSLGGDAAEGIGLLIRSMAEIGAKYPILFQGADNVHRASEPPSEPPPEETSPSSHDTASIVEQFDVLILRGQREGTVRADLAPEILRHSLLGALSASLKLVRATPPGTGPTALEVGAQVAAILVDGLRPQKG